MASVGPCIKDVGNAYGGRGLKLSKNCRHYSAKTDNMGEGGVKKQGNHADVFYVRPQTTVKTKPRLAKKASERNQNLRW